MTSTPTARTEDGYVVRDFDGRTCVALLNDGGAGVWYTTGNGGSIVRLGGGSRLTAEQLEAWIRDWKAGHEIASRVSARDVKPALLRALESGPDVLRAFESRPGAVEAEHPDSGTIVARAREISGMSGPDFARVLGYSGSDVTRANRISDFERGRREPPPAVLQLCRVICDLGYVPGVLLYR